MKKDIPAQEKIVYKSQSPTEKIKLKMHVWRIN